MKREIERPPKVAICRHCKGTGRVIVKEYEVFTEKSGKADSSTCPQCEGSGRVTVSCQMTVDIRPYKPNPSKRR